MLWPPSAYIAYMAVVERGAAPNCELTDSLGGSGFFTPDIQPSLISSWLCTGASFGWLSLTVVSSAGFGGSDATAGGSPPGATGGATPSSFGGLLLVDAPQPISQLQSRSDVSFSVEPQSVNRNLWREEQKQPSIRGFRKPKL